MVSALFVTNPAGLSITKISLSSNKILGANMAKTRFNRVELLFFLIYKDEDDT